MDQSIPDNISPDLADELRSRMIKFAEEFPVPPNEESPYIPSHALSSEKFARKMGVEPHLLPYVRYHDSGFKFFQEARDHNGQYNNKEFMHIFKDQNMDLNIYLMFNFADNNARDAKLTYWLQEEFLKHGLIKTQILPEQKK